MDLAAHLGMTVAQLQRSMPMREMLLWRVKWQSDPWGERRADLRAAQLLILMTNIHRDKEKHPRPFDDLTEFVLFKREGDGKKPVQDDDDDDAPRPRGAVAAPETVTWFHAIAAQHEMKPPKPSPRQAKAAKAKAH